MTFILLTALIAGHFGCNPDDGVSDPGEGEITIDLTDAAVDDEQVAGVYLTFKELYIDDLPVGNFTPQTVDLTDYQDGATYPLGQTPLAAFAYTDLTLVLDFSQDEEGNAPGCYLLTTDGQKIDLRNGADIDRAVTVNGQPFTVRRGATSALVIDFDLRKSIVRLDAGYGLVTTPELESALRFAEKQNTGTIEGRCDNCPDFADKVVVYAYEKGNFDRETETNPRGISGVRFTRALTSDDLGADGTFRLHFLPAGDYQLYFAGFNDEAEDGSFELAGEIDLNVVTAVDLIDVTVTAQGTAAVTVDAAGLIPL